MSNDKSPLQQARIGLESVRIVCHNPSAPALRLGLDPGLRPCGSLRQLQQLLNRNAFWGQGRSLADLGTMLRHSAVCVTAWKGHQLIGFGRATSDGVFRGTIWDVVVDSEAGGQGIGRTIVETLLASKALAPCERIYLMTTNGVEFYKKLGFSRASAQVLMIKEKSG